MLITAVRDDRSERRVDGQWPPPLPLRVQLSLWSWHHQYATSKPPESELERCGPVYVCVCVWLITHLCPLSEPRPFSPFVRRASEETRGPSRHEITDYTLNASPRGLDGAQESKIEGERGKKNRGRERETKKKGEKQTRE